MTTAIVSLFSQTPMIAIVIVAVYLLYARLDRLELRILRIETKMELLLNGRGKDRR